MVLVGWGGCGQLWYRWGVVGVVSYGIGGVWWVWSVMVWVGVWWVWSVMV